MSRKEKNNLTKTLNKTIDIIEVLGNSDEPMRLTDLSKTLAMHKSTVYRLLSTLSTRGYVEQDPSTERYELTLKFLEVGNKILERIDLRKKSSPVLNNLSEKTKEAIHLIVLDGDEMVYIDKIEGSGTFKTWSRIGMHAPLHCTAAGKVLLSSLPEKEINRIIGKGLPRCTPNTIASAEKLKEHLKEVMKKSYAVDNIEYEDEVRCVAAPIKNHEGKVVGAVSISGHESHFSNKKLRHSIKIVKKAAEKISYKIGYGG